MTKRVHPMAALIALVTMSAAGCATGKVEKKVEMVWPLPPDPPRIKFIRSVSSSDDVAGGGTTLDRLAEALAGQEEKIRIKKPYGVAADSRGRLFVADTGWGKVLVFDFPNKRFEMWGQSGPGILSKPVGLALDSKQNLYVSDVKQARVVCFRPDGTFLRAYGRKGELARPVGIAVDEKRSRLYVVDVKASQLAVFALDSTALITKIGKRGRGPAEFNFPTNIAIDREGNILVMDSMNFRLQVLTPTGEQLKQFGGNCDGPGCMPRSKGVAVDSYGHVYVVDAAFNLVQVFDESGRLLLAFGGVGRKPGLLWLPAGIFIDARNRIYVADQYNYRVNIYQYLHVAEKTVPLKRVKEDSEDRGFPVPDRLKDGERR
ncbi:MAG: 6-bladed beta-propeller [Deltaproteobacteria bacterium]|nr:MAG: 6-bladed beta-propeller [Deltaproteobacteria bacterium]